MKTRKKTLIWILKQLFSIYIGKDTRKRLFLELSVYDLSNS